VEDDPAAEPAPITCACSGSAHCEGSIVRDDDGLPIQLGEPLISVDEWQRIQAILDGNSEARKDARMSEVTMWAGLVFCARVRVGDAPRRELGSTGREAIPLPLRQVQNTMLSANPSRGDRGS